MNTPWLIRPAPNPSAVLRLVCLPHAGGGANQFRHWPAGLSPAVEVCAVQLPGRETRFREPPIPHYQPLIAALADALLPSLDRPYALYGHSLGALLAFELVRELRRRGIPGPVHLIVAAYTAPQLPRDRPPLHALPDDEFCEALRVRGGTPAVVLNHAELMQLFLPMIRADFAVSETYTYQPESPLDCPLSVLAGDNDPLAPLSRLTPWSELTTGPFESIVLPGHHFFPQTQQALVLQTIRRLLARSLGEESVEWRKSSAPPRLAEGEVQVWRFALERSAEETAWLEALLDPAERDRARRFRFPADQDRYIVGRGMLRLLLAQQVGQAPDQLRIGYEAAGKPKLIDHPLQFNLAHSGGLGLLAVTRKETVGVDVEWMRPSIEIESIAGRYFAPDEQTLLGSLPGPERVTGFFRVWTRKEAYMKATGMGLYMPLEKFAVLPAPAGRALRLRLNETPAEAARWGLRDLELPPGYVGALAVAGHGWRLTCWEAPDLDVALTSGGR